MRKVCIFTGNRAEYGLLRTTIKAVHNHPDLQLQLMVSGAHLDKNYGDTIKDILSDGLEVTAKVQLPSGEHSLVSTVKVIGEAIKLYAEQFCSLVPDFVVVYADRYEGFAAAIAASQLNIPLAHIEGGDLTEGGALDDSVRHAITKLSHLHFATNEEAYNRILSLGEESWRVFNVGLPSLDALSGATIASKQELENDLGVNLSKPTIVFTQHSVTTQFKDADAQVAPALNALERISANGVNVIVTYPNNDAGGAQIISRIKDVAVKAGFVVRKSLGSRNYHGMLNLARTPELKVACVGNSSSGIKETAFFGCPTVNIGSRQEGRLRADNVIDVPYCADAIYKAAERALFDSSFREICRNAVNPYGAGQAGKEIAEILASDFKDFQITAKKMTLRGIIKNGWYQ